MEKKSAFVLKESAMAKLLSDLHDIFPESWQIDSRTGAEFPPNIVT